MYIFSLAVYSEDDVYLTTCPTTYNNIPTDCNLFGSYFEADSSNFKDIMNITETGTYWIGAKIGFKRNINPLGMFITLILDYFKVT